MYTVHFGLREPPFTLTPNPAYVYFSRCHQEALAHLLYGAGEDGGFVQLTGEVGTGKTTLVRTLLEQRLENVDVALCLNPQLTVQELLATMFDELGIPRPDQPAAPGDFADAMQFLNRSMTVGKAVLLKPWLDALNAHLLQTYAAGRRTLLIIDEAQHLSREVLEQLRLLTNLETTRHKLLRIILVGQPELRETLSRTDLRQLAQRITARYHLPPLNRRETLAYIHHRLQVAGGRPELFTRSAQWLVYHRSGGVPRLINIICDRALLGAYTENAGQVSRRQVRQAAREALPESIPHPRRTLKLAFGLGLAGLALTGVSLWPHYAEPLSSFTRSVAASLNPPGRRADQAMAVPDLASLLPRANEAETHRRLLALWSVEQPAIGSADLCEQAAAHQLRCLSGRSHWDRLQRYNRPAVLRLNAAPALLQALSEDTATLEIAGQVVKMPLTQLNPWWNGEFLLLWRPQVALELMGPGSSGEAVRWLRQRLALVRNQPVPEAPSAVFDAALSEQLRAFQRDQGLQPDGLAGPHTLLILHGLAPEPGTPALRPAGQEP